MSSILWLKLDGIRSYCYVPSNQHLENAANARKKGEQEQSIQFKMPLTLIWGHNGSGKTTIIEALRAVTSGTQPPNSDKGKNFLTDSQLLRQSQTQAVIELGLSTLNRRELIVRRHFTITNTASTSKFSTGRSTIQVKDKVSGALETLNHTCADVDRQIPFFLGVSVPILTNVIFCHQEEQLWMFSDNSTLKKIFDELFETTQYSKLQEQLKEQIKKNTNEVKQLGEKLQYSRRDMTDGVRAKELCSNEMVEIEKEGVELEQIQSQLKLISNKLNKQPYGEILLNKQQQLSVMEYQMKQNRELIKQLEDDQVYIELMEKSLNELETGKFQLETKKQELHLSKIRANATVEQIILNIDRKRNELQINESELNIDSVKQEIRNLKIQITGVISVRQNIGDDQLLKYCVEQLNGISQDIKECQQNDVINDLQSQVEQMTMKRQKMQLKAEQQQIQQIANKQEIIQINNQIEEYERTLQSTQFNKEENDDQLNQNKLEELRLKHKELSNQQLQYYKIQQLNTGIQKYQELSEQLKNVELKIAEDQQKMDIIIRDNGWRSNFKLKSTNRVQEIQIQQQKLEQAKGETQIKESQISQLQTQMKQLQIELSDVSHQEDTLIKLKQKIREAKEDKIKYVFNTNEFIDQYIDGCTQSKKCILCFQSIDQNILDKLRTRVQNNMQRSKAKIEEKENIILQLRNQKDALLQNKDKFLKNKQIQQQIQLIEQQIKELSASCRPLPELLQQLKDLELLKKLSNVDHEQQKSILLQKLTQLPDYSQSNQQQLPNLDKIIQQKQIIEQQIQQLEIEIQNQNKRKQQNKQINEKLIIIKSELPQLKERLLLLQNIQYEQFNVQKIIAEEQQLQLQLQMNIQQQDKQKQQLMKKQGQLESIIPQLEKMIMKLNDLKKKNNTNTLEIRKKLQQEIDNLEINLAEDQQLLKDIFNKIDEIQTFIVAIEKQIQIVQLKQQLFGDVQLRQEIQEIQILLQQQQQIEQEQISLQSKYVIQKQKLLERFNKYSLNKQDIDKRYKNSELNYQNVIYQHDILKQINDDYQQYYKQVEEAMIQYHRDKMKEINQFLHDIWQRIYHQNDIKFIEIKSDEDITKKKSYNYRLIMRTANNTEIDMKGRCSMGQKMLASIVFRMALAESFGSNCGILALDEPTANLDREHIKCLADSLNDLIDLMDTYKQCFQLLIITHDLDLVKHLSKHSQTYFKIQKKDNGFSAIEERQIEELQ